MTNVLFVCSANRLRSPTAEQIFSTWPGIETDSAGISNGASVPLSSEQVERYQYDGYVFPFPALAAAEVDRAMANFARYEGWLGKPLSAAALPMRGCTHLYLPWVAELCSDPRILDAVEDVIGPDILVYFSTFFLKEPQSTSFTAWHQDSTSLRKKRS